MPIRWDTRNKRWRYEFDRVIEGRRQRTSKLLPKGWSQAQADAFDRRESARLYAVGSGIQQADPLIETAVTHYLRDKTNLKSYRSALENLAAIAWAYEGKTFRDLPAVATLVNETRQGVRDDVVLSDATVKNRLALLKAACRWGWKKHDMCDTDPTARMQMPSVRNERHVYASRQQVGRLARACDRRDLRALILAAFYTGMRLGELQRVVPDGNRLILADTKNGERRVIPAHPKLRRLGILKMLPFTAPKITLQRSYQRVRVRAGLPHIRIHDLRHTAASEMINAEVDLFTVGAVLGHKDPRSTKRYAHLRHETLAGAIGKIGQKSPHTTPAKTTKKAARKAA
jgi:integrase